MLAHHTHRCKIFYAVLGIALVVLGVRATFGFIDMSKWVRLNLDQKILKNLEKVFDLHQTLAYGI